MDLDLRKLRYFVAVAQELHFGRAAEQLHIAQPVLSRQIRALEGELRVQLFDRDHRSTELTAAGRQLLDDAVGLLAAAEATCRRVRQAADSRPRFAIGFMPGITVTATVRALTSRHPELVVNVVRTSWDDQIQVVHDGRVDVSIIRLPVDRRGLTLRPLFSEPRVAVLPSGHRLAGKSSVGIDDLADEPLLQHPDAVPEWRDLPGRPSDESAQQPPDFHSVEEKLEHVAAGEGVIVLPQSTTTYYTRPDIAYVPIEDIGPNQVCLAWSSARRSPLIDEVADLAEAQYALHATITDQP
ncbi:LysR family transcriptional regulator [Streptomyces sp. R41]|uniref:LysR family transcriptional regulator n=1 Tax=Streptomyces sp. R41 TaxID=3238632 RepID=A0AB39RQ74_9ACTN